MKRLVVWSSLVWLATGCASFTGASAGRSEFSSPLLNAAAPAPYRREGWQAEQESDTDKVAKARAALEGASRPARPAAPARAAEAAPAATPRAERGERVKPTRPASEVAKPAAAPARQQAERPAPSRPAPARPEAAPAKPSSSASNASAGPADVKPTRGSGSYTPEFAAGYVVAVYAANDVTLGSAAAGSIADLYRKAQQTGTIYHSSRPAVGDLIFFHNTFDRNADGRQNDWYSHVGIVESVDEQGTIALLSYLGGKVGRTYMNLESPALAERAGKTLNTRMKAESTGSEFLAGKLFAGFASLLGNRTEVVVLDEWQPKPADVASK
jgi:hypothetical protein